MREQTMTVLPKYRLGSLRALPLSAEHVLLAGDADADPLRVIEYGAAPVYNTTLAELPQKLPARKGWKKSNPLASSRLPSCVRPVH